MIYPRFNRREVTFLCSPKELLEGRLEHFTTAHDMGWKSPENDIISDKPQAPAHDNDDFHEETD